MHHFVYSLQLFLANDDSKAETIESDDLWTSQISSADHSLPRKTSILAMEGSTVTLPRSRLVTAIERDEPSVLASIRSSPSHPDSAYFVTSTAATLEMSKSSSDFHANVKHFSVLAKGISLCLIDDCEGRDIPLIECKLFNISVNGRSLLQLHAMNTDTAGKASMSIQADFYNPLLSAWEPCIEPWLFSVQLNTLSANSNSPKQRAQIQSEEVFRLNMTKQMLATIVATSASWSSNFDSQLRAVSERTPFIPYYIVNSTGLPLKFWCITDTARHELPSFVGIDEEKVSPSTCR
jgi:hypothetical protein